MSARAHTFSRHVAVSQAQTTIKWTYKQLSLILLALIAYERYALFSFSLHENMYQLMSAVRVLLIV